MKEVYLEQRGATDDTEHNKFFRITDDGHTVRSYWGAIGAKGQGPKVLVESDDPEVRQKAWDKKFKEKTGKKKNPYVVIRSSDAEGSITHIEERPSDEGRKFGLEVETHTNLDKDLILQKMAERQLHVTDNSGRYFHSRGDTWDLKRDGSCGLEFASSIMSGDLGIFTSKLALEKIREVCANAVNRKCGIHVTVSVEDHSEDELKRLIIGYLKAQEHFYNLCASWRQDNQYCQRNPVVHIHRMLRTKSVDEIVRLAGGQSRYHGFNLTRLRTIKAVEFRMLESSVDIRKVGGWIRTCVGFVDGLKASGMTFMSSSLFTEDTFKKICESKWRKK